MDITVKWPNGVDHKWPLYTWSFSSYLKPIQLDFNNPSMNYFRIALINHSETELCMEPLVAMNFHTIITKACNPLEDAQLFYTTYYGEVCSKFFSRTESLCLTRTVSKEDEDILSLELLSLGTVPSKMDNILYLSFDGVIMLNWNNNL